MRYRKLGACVVAGMLGLGATATRQASADSITANITGVKYATSGYTTVGVIFNGTNYGQVIAGPEMWHETSGTINLGDANGDFLTFCVEINQDVYLGGTYTFTTGTVASAPTPGTPLPGSGGMGTIKANLLNDLWTRHYSDVTDATTGAAFQVAVWEVVYDTNFNLGTDNFQAYGKQRRDDAGRHLAHRHPQQPHPGRCPPDRNQERHLPGSGNLRPPAAEPAPRHPPAVGGLGRTGAPGLGRRPPTPTPRPALIGSLKTTPHTHESACVLPWTELILHPM